MYRNESFTKPPFMGALKLNNMSDRLKRTTRLLAIGAEKEQLKIKQEQILLNSQIKDRNHAISTVRTLELVMYQYLSDFVKHLVETENKFRNIGNQMLKDRIEKYLSDATNQYFDSFEKVLTELRGKTREL
jgi:hypothetical protein